VSEKYSFIEAERAQVDDPAPTVSQMCSWLAVSRSGFYEWRSRPVSESEVRRQWLKLLVKRAFDDSDGTYGYRRVHAQLARWRVVVDREVVRRLMRELDLHPCQPRPWRPTTTEQGDEVARIPDLVRRDFTAATPGAKMVGDITYIPTWEGWAYLATVIDCATRKVIGWAIEDHYRTSLITAAIEMAARNVALPAGAVFHSDRGSNYTSHDFAAVLRRLGISQSVGRTGTCYDNALAESFNGALKVECVHRKVYPTREHAKRDIARYIEVRYNRKRLHSSLGYRTPQEAYDDYQTAVMAG
jgi:putative transposase